MAYRQFQPRFSPNGSEIAFTSDAGGGDAETLHETVTGTRRTEPFYWQLEKGNPIPNKSNVPG
jgi:hypothetical protein